MGVEYNLHDCTLCPRECHADRASGMRGLCGCDDGIYVSRAALHQWEEPCISGTKGSGTIFFSGCVLGCIYCQNREIALNMHGRKIGIDRLAEICLELMERGAHNINLVTPSHYVLHIACALAKARDMGLTIPVVYNCGGYEKVESLKMLDGLVDVYLPDMKYMSSERALRYSKAADYPETAMKALSEMFRQTGTPVFDGDMMVRGMIVRHLVLPAGKQDSKNVIRYLYDTYGDDIYMSIMSQYTPMPDFTDGGRLRQNYPELGRRVRRKDYDEVVDYAIDLGVTNAFIQEGDVAKDSFIPDFDSYEGV